MSRERISHSPPPDSTKWQRITPAEAGWDATAVDAALEFAGSRRSTAVVVLYRGKIMAAKHWDPAKQRLNDRWQFERTPAGQIREDVASVQKSVVAVLCGIARQKGLIKLGDAVSNYLSEGWTKASREVEAGITIRHLLTMTGGLTDSLEYEAEPGAKWRYNSVAYQKLLPALAKASGKSSNELTREWLTTHVGMLNSEWRDRSASPGMVGFVTSAEDLARFGLLVQAEGKWAGKQVVDAKWLQEMLRPSQELNPAYGYLWWLNGHPRLNAAGKRSEMLIPSAPKDLVAALGALGRKVYVAPSLGLVITRTGDNSDVKGEPPFDEAFWSRLMKARR